MWGRGSVINEFIFAILSVQFEFGCSCFGCAVWAGAFLFLLCSLGRSKVCGHLMGGAAEWKGWEQRERGAMRTPPDGQIWWPMDSSLQRRTNGRPDGQIKGGARENLCSVQLTVVGLCLCLSEEEKGYPPLLVTWNFFFCNLLFIKPVNPVHQWLACTFITGRIPLPWVRKDESFIYFWETPVSSDSAYPEVIP